MDKDTANFWKDIELRIDQDPLCTSCHIFSMNIKASSKDSLNPKVTFKWVYGYYSSNITKTFDK